MLPVAQGGDPGAHRGAVELGLGGVVRGGGALLHPAHALLGPRVEKKGFGEGGLAASRVPYQGNRSDHGASFLVPIV
ncbi:hypothetical protein TTMY_2101 [Thermus thermophilus]|nr:hypothetical protein TTMY_2101 [Thermus thermophilus]